MRPSWVEVDLSAISANVAALAALAAPARLCAVVKADAYGHGDVPVAETALAAGAAMLAVAMVEEGIRLREAGITAPILVLSEPPPEAAHEMIRWDLEPTVYRHVMLEALVTEMHRSEAAQPLAVQIKVDTGMHRVGADEATALQLAHRIAGASSPLRAAGLWTHFSVADEDPDFTRIQIDRFNAFAERVRGAGLETGPLHMANTAGAVLHPDSRADLVRAGLGIYGLYPSPACAEVVVLEPALRLVSRVSFLRRHAAGVRPSYGRRRALESESTVATVPIGYADGVPRILSQRGGEVLIRGKRYPLAGTVTMDQIVVDLGDDDAVVGDEVVLVGRQGDAEITVDEWAERTETISYEIVCGLGPRLPRHHVGVAHA
ncbi:MAG: alanine racemase [Acidimicrobiia bacterium]|nr:alanine racemase [Acidimicrobiia bacterium]